MKILLLGSDHSSTSVAYKKFNLSESVLVTDKNQNYIVGHTARQEFSSDLELKSTLKNATEVYWTFPNITEFKSEEEFYTFLNWLKTYQLTYKNIKNFSEISFDPYGYRMQLPVLTDNDAVFLGCSFTAGVALPGDITNRYANIVSNRFEKNCVNLSKGGSSNNYALDIFSQLDFIEGQIVILQLTGLERLRYISNRTIQDVMFSLDPRARDFLKIYNHDFLLYELIVKLRLVIKIAREKKLKFLFWLINYKNPEIYSQVDQMYFYNYPEFVPASIMGNYLVDFGTDNLHPGTESNKIIANVIIDYLDKIYEI
jgi:hypothetical protein